MPGFDKPNEKDTMAGQKPYVKSMHFFDTDGDMIGEAILVNPVLAGHRDVVSLQFSWCDDDGSTMKVEMNVQCPECCRNYLHDSTMDYVCAPCREAMDSGPKA